MPHSLPTKHRRTLEQSYLPPQSQDHIHEQVRDGPDQHALFEPRLQIEPDERPHRNSEPCILHTSNKCLFHFRF